MKKILLVAAAALGATAVAPQTALAQRDRGAHERQRDDDGQRWRGEDGERRGHNFGDQNVSGGAPPEQPQERNWRPEQDRGARGQGELAGGPRRGPPENASPPPAGFNGRNIPPTPAAQGNGGRGWRQGGDVERDRGQGENGDSGRGQGQGQGWNGVRDRGQSERQGWNDGRGRGRGQGEHQGRNGETGRGQGEGWSSGRDRGEHQGSNGQRGRERGEQQGWNGGRGQGERQGWNGERTRGRAEHDGRNDRGRGGRDWGHDGRRDWSDNDQWRRNWDRGRHDNRYRPYWNTHRDFSHPRFSDWRRIRHGYYFDRGYARILSGYYGRNYYWWSYDGWHRPYRRWSIGYVIPSWLYWEDLPWDLYYRLPPAPYGCRYVYADGDVLLIAIASGIILDALLYEDGYY